MANTCKVVILEFKPSPDFGAPAGAQLLLEDYEMSRFICWGVMRERIVCLGNKAALRPAGWPVARHRLAHPGSGHGLLRPGADPRGHQSGEMVGIYARNMPEWTQADLRHPAARGVSVPIYPPAPPISCATWVKDAGIGMLFVGNSPSSIQAPQLIDSGEIRHIVALDGTVDLQVAAPLLPATSRPSSPPATTHSSERGWRARAPLPHGRPADPDLHLGHHGRTRESCSTSPTWPPASRCA